MPSSPSILIIDDNKDLAETLASDLAKEGYRAFTALSAAEALSFLKQNEAPTFILADRMLSEPIEVRDLERLRRAAPTSKVLVYTSVDEKLGPEQLYSIRSKGAYRVFDKSAVEQLVADIKVLTQDLSELLELSRELETTTQERSKIIAALVGSDVSVTVIDRHFYRWYHSATGDRFGGACREKCWTTSSLEALGPAICWGCTVSEVFESKAPVDTICFSKCPDGSYRWLAIRSTPITGAATGAIMAVREAVTKLTDSAVTSLPMEQRLYHIARSLIRVGFGRARIYEAVAPNKVRLIAAAARSDPSQGHNSPYFDSLRDLPIDPAECPYMLQALGNKLGKFVREWDPEFGPSTHAKGPLGLEPPYFDIPVWRDDSQLFGWIAVDFAGMESVLQQRAFMHLATEESLTWIREGYCREVKRVLETSKGRPEQRDKFEIAQRARLGIANAKRVDDATREIREAFGKLFPSCRVSVRSCTGLGLREFERLCWGPRDRSIPDLISLEDERSLSAYVARTQISLWLSNYPEYFALAGRRGDPPGYPASGTRSTAQIPLRFENTVFGTLSIDSPDLIQWDDEGYKEPVLGLAKDTALVLRDLALHEERDQAMADRAAIIAYSVSASADALWRHWAQQRLAEASAQIWRARRLVEPDSPIDQLLTRITTVITRVHTARPGDDAPQSCTVSEIIVKLKDIYADRHPAIRFVATEGLRSVRIPAFILQRILMILIDNATFAISSSGVGELVTVDTRGGDGDVFVDVLDDGPGIAPPLREILLKEPVNSRSGQGLGLLYARGAALQYGGDLVFAPLDHGVRFTLRLKTG